MMRTQSVNARLKGHFSWNGSGTEILTTEVYLILKTYNHALDR
jgi:hypothetical protein